MVNNKTSELKETLTRYLNHLKTNFPESNKKINELSAMLDSINNGTMENGGGRFRWCF